MVVDRAIQRERRRMAISTARLFSTGEVPGKPRPPGRRGVGRIAEASQQPQKIFFW